ncbi:sugar phosphate isomerase/epimerase family protein [Micromonosporaceae bacterium Da 78-11]
MRLRHSSGRIVHLSHEISPAPAGNLPAVISRFDTYAAVRAVLGADALGVSLRLPPALAAALAVDGRARTRLRAELDARSLEVVTLSGAPFAEGGGEPGRDDPGWDDAARREHTLDLARILLDLLPEDSVRGAVNTVGLHRRTGWDETAQKTGAGLLRRLSAGLADLAWQYGRAIRVGFEPMPGYVVDSPEETVAALARIDKDRLGVSLDLGHVARTWPAPAAGIDTITDAGLAIIEIRLAVESGAVAESWRAALARVLGVTGPLTEFLTVVTPGTDPSAEQIGADLAYVLAELATLGLAPENEPCAVR